MATHTGDEGIVKVGGTNVVAEVRSFSLETSSGVIEDTAKGDTHNTFKAGRKSWTAQIDCWWDETDANGQATLVAGATVTVTLLPEGDSSGDAKFEGTGLVTSRTINSGEGESVVEASISVQGSGALDETPLV